MSNPFDQFASELGAAMPGAPPPQQAPPAYGAPPPAQPYGAPPPAYGAPPPQPYGAPPPQPYGAPPPAGDSAFGAPPPAAPAPVAPASDPFGGFGAAPPPAAPPQAPAPPPPAAEPAGLDNPFGAPAPQPQNPPPTASFDSSVPGQQPPPGQPPMPPAGGAVDPWGGASMAPTMQAPPQEPYGAPPAAPPQQDFGPYGAPPPAQDAGALVPANVQNNPYAAAPPQPYGAPPPQPYGAPPPQPYGEPYGAPPQAAAAPPVDPFSVFNAAPAPPAAPSTALVPAEGSGAYPGAPPAAPAAAADEDFWGAFSSTPAPVQGQPGQKLEVSADEKKAEGSDELPPGGEWYDARIFTPTLGVMFFKPQELTDSLFLNTDKNIVDSLNERPVVAFIVEGSSARSAGVELGHVLLKVNGVDVKNPKEASRLIKEGPRPLPLLFYVPNTEVVVAEGEHMVKYDTRETTAPNSAKDWKPKYVVIGGIIAQPWMMNMYRSKSEYDIAVIETQARRPVSVKVKQFSLQGARIQNDWQGPQMVKYKNKLHPWKYIVVLPVARNPIKISSPNLASLKPVHEGIRRVLLAQQRDRGNKPSQSNHQQHQQQHQQQQQPPQQQQPQYHQAPPPQQQPAYGQPPQQQYGY
eukprot:CAMPEP_0172451460 /NCGR_PEP_ID=MMETSP1065-20121228/9503_1 /TAXON_ID=265537 /ORGANISM="Amphiprora paludosa, Strain CCMP125" /LENGTH=631 /DNA_ID=CAMNT_0013203421 /DNA_START=120 /DNA_END=2015 /DNA_ORIENTATION=+